MTENLSAYKLDHHFIFFPAGGTFNKFRATSPNCQYLDQLFDNSMRGYSTARSKRSYVYDNILSKIPGSIKIWKGKSPHRGCLITLTDEQAYDKVTQVMRDRKKRRKYDNPPPLEVVMPRTPRIVHKKHGTCDTEAWMCG